MGRNCRDAVSSSKLAIGVEGDRHSLCGAIKRFERRGRYRNGLLSLKERCARRIALIKNEQIKWFITAFLPSHLFKYVTKDIFDLRGLQFKSNYPKPLYMCQECTMDTYEDPPDNCQCPNMDAAIDALNKCLFKRSTNETNQARGRKLKQFELIYKIPNDEQDHTGELDGGVSFFLYLSPTVHEADYDNLDCYGASEEYTLIGSHISTEDKLLFVDAMRFFGGFRTDLREPQFILYHRREFIL